MIFKKGDFVEVSITDLAFGGSGIGRIERFVIFVEGTIPGDFVRARLTKIKRDYGEAVIESILKKSPQRIAPRCKHFEICGGCTLQFLSYEDQLEWKEKMVLDSLERIGGITHPPIEPIRESPSPWFYRNKMEYTFVENDGNGVSLGLHRAKKFDEVFDVEECYLQSKFSVEVIDWVRGWMNQKKAYLPHGSLKTLVIREARSTGEFMVNLVTAGESFRLAEEFSREIIHAFPQITSLYHTAVRIQKGFRTTARETLLAGKPILTEIIRVEGNFRDGETVLSLIFDITPSAFFQTNTKAAEGLLAVLLALGNPRQDEIVFDLYCGTGIMGMFFAKLAKRVYGIELNASALETARKNAAKNSLKNIEFSCGDVGKIIRRISEKPTTVIVDPPRAGLSSKTIDHLRALSPRKILYVSCNPTTLSRDLKEFLSSGYTLKKVQPIDMFPQTYHVETVCLLERFGP